MLDTGKDAIDVSATVTAKVGETAVEKSAQGIGGILKLLLKLLQVVLQKAADKIANRKGNRKIETLMGNGDSTSYLELPAELDQKLFRKQMQKQGKRLAFQFSFTKSGGASILTYKDKDAQVVRLAFQNLKREATMKGKRMPDIEMPNMTQTEEHHKSTTKQIAQAAKNTQEEYSYNPEKQRYEPIKVERDQEGFFYYSRGRLSVISKGEKGEVLRQRLQKTFGINEKSAWAVWNQGLDLSKNAKVANRSSIHDNISKAQKKQQADIKASKQAPKAKTQSTQKATPAAGMAR